MNESKILTQNTNSHLVNHMCMKIQKQNKNKNNKFTQCEFAYKIDGDL